MVPPCDNVSLLCLPMCCGSASALTVQTHDVLCEQAGAFKFQGAMLKSLQHVGKVKNVLGFSWKTEDMKWTAKEATLVIKPVYQKGQSRCARAQAQPRTHAHRRTLTHCLNIPIGAIRADTLTACSVLCSGSRTEGWRQERLSACQGGAAKESLFSPRIVEVGVGRRGHAQVCRRRCAHPHFNILLCPFGCFLHRTAPACVVFIVTSLDR